MECSIPGGAVKVFGKAIHSMSKIGKDMFLEADHEKLALRTVNDSRSAFACFQFYAGDFFDSYRLADQEEEQVLRCKTTNKACLSVFKSLGHIDKSVEFCSIRYDAAASLLIFQLHCHHGIEKTHKLHVEECDNLSAEYNRDECPNTIIGAAAVFSECVHNFQSRLGEISFNASPDTLQLTNYVEVDPENVDRSSLLRTRLSLSQIEFQTFRIDSPCQVTFCLRELKAILAFSEFVSQPLALHFEDSGKPIVFHLHGLGFEVDVVLATLVESANEDDISMSGTQPGGSRAGTTQSQTQQHGHQRTAAMDLPSSSVSSFPSRTNGTGSRGFEPSASMGRRDDDRHSTASGRSQQYLPTGGLSQATRDGVSGGRVATFDDESQMGMESDGHATAISVGQSTPLAEWSQPLAPPASGVAAAPAADATQPDPASTSTGAEFGPPVTLDKDPSLIGLSRSESPPPTAECDEDFVEGTPVRKQRRFMFQTLAASGADGQMVEYAGAAIQTLAEDTDDEEMSLEI